MAELFHDAQIPATRVESLENEPQPGIIEITTGQHRQGVRLRRTETRPADRSRPAGPCLRTLHPGHAEDALATAQRRRSAAVDRGRLRGPRTARRGQVRGTRSALHRGRTDQDHARVPGARIRPVQARRTRGPAVCTDGPAGPGHPLRRRRDTPSLSKMGGSDWAKTKNQARKAVKEIAGRADPAVFGADGVARVRLRSGHPVAAGAGRGVPVRGDARPADHHQRGQGRHGA